MNSCCMCLCGAGSGDWTLMGDEKETWKVKTLDEILQEKKRRRELEERTDPKRQKNVSIMTNLLGESYDVLKTIPNHSHCLLVLLVISFLY